jgi:hypothetical protein
MSTTLPKILTLLSANKNQLNTSSLGKNLLNATQTSSAPQTKPTSITTWLTNTIQNITNDIEDTLTAIENNIADKLAAELGIKQWYSFHLTDMCEGNFSPNATTPGAGLNISQCSNMTAMCKPALYIQTLLFSLS